MARQITQRQLRNDSGEVLRRLDVGESFIISRNGRAVGQLTPLGQRRFVPKDAVLAAFAGAAPVDYESLRSDLDALVSQEIEPHV